MEKIRVLFLCIHNTSRSQMAEAFLRSLAGDEFEAYSAGLEPQEIHPLAIAAMLERGIDISAQHAKPLSEFMGRVHFAYLITVCERAERECPTTFPGMGQRLFWPFDDPAAVEGSEKERLAAFRQVRDEIEARLVQWLAEQRAASVRQG